MDQLQYASLHTMRPSIRSRSGAILTGDSDGDFDGGVGGGEIDSAPTEWASPKEKPFTHYTRWFRSATMLITTNFALAIAIAILLLILLVIAVASFAAEGGGEGGPVGGRFVCPTVGMMSVAGHARIGSGRRGLSGASASGAGEVIRPFIYVYDFGAEFTGDIRKMTPSWYSEVYDAERIFYEYVLEMRAIRTWDPEAATLFYVPFFSAYYTSCNYRDWDVNMKEAIMKTSQRQVWDRLIRRVRSEFPYFNRTNGHDHFSLLSMDFGRCQALPFVDPRVTSDMFFLQMNGDRDIRTAHTLATRNMQVISYNYGKPLYTDVPDIACYKPGVDIVIPPPLEHTSKLVPSITLPQSSERSITALFRFRPNHHHNEPVFHHNHDIRRELYEMFEKKGITGWDFGVREPEKVLREDLQHSVFCICPPGHSQWTSRVAKAILAGCIPVTFFRGNDNPWQDELDYTKFSVNVDPDEMESLVERLNSIMRNPRRLLRMQKNIKSIQVLFAWEANAAEGVLAHLSRVLWCRSKALEEGPVGHMRSEARANKHY